MEAHLLRILGIMALTAALAPLAAMAQNDEIVVTASKREWASDKGYEQPHVVRKKRPDNLIVEVSVLNDTRNAAERYRELEETMSALVDEASRIPIIELGVIIEREDEDGYTAQFVRPYDHSRFEDLVTSGYRPDTSAVNLIVKTPVKSSYTSEQDALGVIERFVEGVETTGRTEINDDDEPILSIINPSQYRYEIIDDIAKDANRVVKAFGSDYRVSVDGLETPIVFYQTDELELTLYIPYGFTVLPTNEK